MNIDTYTKVFGLPITHGDCVGRSTGGEDAQRFPEMHSRLYEKKAGKVLIRAMVLISENSCDAVLSRTTICCSEGHPIGRSCLDEVPVKDEDDETVEEYIVRCVAWAFVNITNNALDADIEPCENTVQAAKKLLFG